MGEHDVLAPAHALTGALPRGELLVIPALDHFRTPGDPRTLTAALNFLLMHQHHQDALSALT